MKKNVIIGLGEIGSPIFQAIKKSGPTVGYDKNPKLMNKQELKKFENLETLFLHICIPYNKNFGKIINTYSKKFQPDIIVIHSTIEPYTTLKIQKKNSIPIIYSATRGVHKRMLSDLKKYTKFFAIDPLVPNANSASRKFVQLMKKCNIKTKRMTDPLTLELAKIVVDTSYYGWLINYAQISNLIAMKNEINYDEMWSFADEIHKFLGNRPKMYPGFIGGHCVIPNLDLIHNQTLNLIKKMNSRYGKKVKNSKTIYKKYSK